MRSVVTFVLMLVSLLPVACSSAATDDASDSTSEAIGGAGKGVWPPNFVLYAGVTIHSLDNRFLLHMQGDGNLVLYQANGVALWASNTADHAGARAVMQGDGNLVVYGPYGAALFSTSTAGHAGASAVVQDDGNFVIYQNGVALWSSGTCCH
jgi:hypothetical protein